MDKQFNWIFYTIFILVSSVIVSFVTIISNDDQEIIQSIKFNHSKYELKVFISRQELRCMMTIYKDDIRLGPNVDLGPDFTRKSVKIEAIPFGYKLLTKDQNEMSITIDVDSSDFISVYVKRNFTNRNVKASACVSLDEDNLNWFGGPQQRHQKYPIQKLILKNLPYVTTEVNSAAIMERYWLASNGFFVLVDLDAPLFVSQNDRKMSDGKVCFTAQKKLPYYTYNDDFTFNYRIGIGANARVTHQNVINRWLGKPHGTPSEKIVRFPIWNSWVRYRRPINETLIAKFADEIIHHGFKYSLMGIDDCWEACYGSLSVNKKTFPNMRDLMMNLKAKGFSVGFWIHPFINTNCEPFYSTAWFKNYFVKSYSGNRLVSWWNTNETGSSHIDFTNPEAISWFKNRLLALQNEFGIDTFKFDGGESNRQPEDPILLGNPSLFPSLNTQGFVKLAADFGNMVEVRTGWGTQHLNVWVRMMDIDSRWGDDNGLKNLIPKLLQLNMNGYVFVLPDMIGGNQRFEEKASKELIIRWLQVSVFMPCLQFSIAPWDFDEQTVNISLKYSKLHEDYADLILKRFKLAVTAGDPVNPPIWWLDPDDKDAQMIDDEFLLGETILAAPIVEKDAYKRDIYLPVGSWKDGNSDTVYKGKRWIRNYDAPIDVLPYFIRQN